MVKNKKIVVTNMSVATIIGNDINTFFNNAVNGNSGIKRITEFDVSKCNTQIGGIINDIPVKKKKYIYDKVIHMSIHLADTILNNDNILDFYNKDNIGIVVGTTEGPSMNKIKFVDKYAKDPDFSSIFTIPASMINLIGSVLSIETGFRGANITVSTTCSSSSNALQIASEYVKNEVVDACLVVGVESPINHIYMKNWDKLGVLSKNNQNPKKAMKPFSANRDGTVISEGGGAVFIESFDNAVKRNANLYSEIISTGISNNSTDLLNPSLESQVLCVEKALKNGQLDINDINYIHAHGNGTKLNDEMETLTIKKVFKEKAYNIPISTIKPMIGHTGGASGILSVITTILCMNKSIVIPTINYEIKDPKCDLNYIPNKSINFQIKKALVNSFGFGGSNVSIILSSF